MKIYIPNIDTLLIDIIRLNDDVSLTFIEYQFNKKYGFNNWFYSYHQAKARLNFYKRERNEIF